MTVLVRCIHRTVAQDMLQRHLLQVSPNHRQAISLKEAVDDRLVRDGLIGVGIGSVAVILAGVVAAALSSRR